MLVHPEFGEIWLDCDVLSAADGDTRIVMYTAAHGSDAHAALDQLTGSNHHDHVTDHEVLTGH